MALDRRQFFSRVAVGAAALLMPRVFAQSDHAACGEADSVRTDGAKGAKSFGYYQALRVNEARSPSRTDGTYNKMPCIALLEMEDAEDRVYEFWHGHGSMAHRFTLTSEHYRSLLSGETIEIYTDLVDGHRHALRISPNEPCT